MRLNAAGPGGVRDGPSPASTPARPVRHYARHDETVHGDELSGLPDTGRLERQQVVETQHIGLVTGSEPAQVVEMVVVSRVARHHHEGIFDAVLPGDGQPYAVIGMSRVEQCLWFTIVGAKRYTVGTVHEDGADQVGEVARGRAFSYEDPHCLASFFLGLADLGALVVGLDARGEVGVEQAPAQAGRVPIDTLVAGRGDLGEHPRVAACDSWEVHELGDPDSAVFVEELG